MPHLKAAAFKRGNMVLCLVNAAAFKRGNMVLCLVRVTLIQITSNLPEIKANICTDLQQEACLLRYVRPCLLSAKELFVFKSLTISTFPSLGDQLKGKLCGQR